MIGINRFRGAIQADPFPKEEEISGKSAPEEARKREHGCIWRGKREMDFLLIEKMKLTKRAIRLDGKSYNLFSQVPSFS